MCGIPKESKRSFFRRRKRFSNLTPFNYYDLTNYRLDGELWAFQIRNPWDRDRTEVIIWEFASSLEKGDKKEGIRDIIASALSVTANLTVLVARQYIFANKNVYNGPGSNRDAQNDRIEPYIIYIMYTVPTVYIYLPLFFQYHIFIDEFFYLKF